MTLTVRSASVIGAVTAGRALTHAEMDANWAHVIQSANQNFLPSGIGGVARTVQAKERDVVSVKDFGALGDGATDDKAAMQLAHNTGALVYYPGGEYRFSGPVTLSSGGIRGDGQIKTFLVSTDTTTADLFQYTGTSAAHFSDFQIQLVGGSAKTVGSGINILSTAGNTASYLSFRGVNFQSLPTGLTFLRASHFKIAQCNFIGCITIACQVENSTNGDSGDSSIVGCEFNSNLTTGIFINQISSSGLKVTGCKFNGAAFGYVLALNTAVAASISIFSGNSFENMSDSGIVLSRAGGSPAASSTWGKVIISGNEFASMPRGINGGSGTFVISDIAVNGNTFSGVGAGGYCVGLNSATNIDIAGNVFNGSGAANTTGISLTSCTGKIGQNVYTGLTASQEISVTTSPNLYIQQDSQSGTATTSAVGWAAWVGALFISPVSTVTFPRAFLIAPAISDISLIAGATAGEMSMIVESVSKTQFTYQVISSVNAIAATTQWKAWGVL